MPDHDPAPEPRRHPPPRGVLALLLIAPALDVVSIATASRTLAGFAAQVARGAVFVVIVRAFALLTGAGTSDREPPAGPADRRARRGRTPRG
jgi:hypothetical protein